MLSSRILSARQGGAVLPLGSSAQPPGKPSCCHGASRAASLPASLPTQAGPWWKSPTPARSRRAGAVTLPEHRATPVVSPMRKTTLRQSSSSPQQRGPRWGVAGWEKAGWPWLQHGVSLRACGYTLFLLGDYVETLPWYNPPPPLTEAPRAPRCPGPRRPYLTLELSWKKKATLALCKLLQFTTCTLCSAAYTELLSCQDLLLLWERIFFPFFSLHK